MIINGFTCLEREASCKRVSTGCVGVDRALRGGLRRGTLTELHGESGSGKTQLCLQVALTAWEKGAIYISTEPFPTRRLHQLLEDRGANGDNIYIQKLSEPEQLLQCLRGSLPALLDRCKADVVILDSVAAPFRVQYTNYAKRAQHMRELAIQLLRIAREHELAVLCVNQVTSSLSDSGSECVPSLGLSWSNMVGTRILVAKTDIFVEESELALEIGSSRKGLYSHKDKSGPDQKVSSAAEDPTTKSENCTNNDEDGQHLEKNVAGVENRKIVVRSLKVVFAPDVPNTKVNFVIFKSGIHHVTPDL